MSIWAAIRPPRPEERSRTRGRRNVMLAVRRFLVWAPALIAVGFALAGLTMVASQQSSNDHGPILREGAAPGASRQIMSTSTAPPR